MRATRIDSMAVGSVLVCLALTAAPAAFAQIDDWVVPGKERFSFNLGAFLPAFSTDVRVDNANLGAGTDVNLRDDLGLERRQSGAYFAGEWRFSPNHRIGIEYSQFSPKGSVTAKKDIQIGDEIYPAGANLNSEFKLRLIPITYSYSFIRTEQQEFSGTIGLQWQRLQLKVNGSASVGGSDVNNDVDAKADLPLPLFGLRWDYNFSRNWSAGLSGGVFSLSVAQDALKAKGTLWSVGGYGEYRFTKNLGLGLAVTSFRVNLDADDSEWKGKIKYTYWGPQLYLVARF